MYHIICWWSSSLCPHFLILKTIAHNRPVFPMTIKGYRNINQQYNDIPYFLVFFLPHLIFLWPFLWLFSFLILIFLWLSFPFLSFPSIPFPSLSFQSLSFSYFIILWLFCFWLTQLEIFRTINVIARCSLSIRWHLNFLRGWLFVRTFICTFSWWMFPCPFSFKIVNPLLCVLNQKCNY